MNLIAFQANLKASQPIMDVIEGFLLTKPSNHTRRAYKPKLVAFFNALELVILEDIGFYQFDELVSKITRYIDSIKETAIEEKTIRVINSRTVNLHINTLRSFFKYLVEVYHYPKNPLKLIDTLRTQKFSNTTSLTRAEMVDLLSYGKGNHRKSEADFRNYLITIFLFNLALRCDECSTLKWEQLKLEEQELNIRQKGDTYKLLPLPLPLCLLLQEFKTMYGQTCPYVFHAVRNNSHKFLDKPLGTKYIFTIIQKKALVVVPNKKITPHSLRKTFIELALNNGDDLISICNATGHGSVEMVKYYDTRSRLKNNSVNSLSGLI
jgi:integrase/recombinase XerC